MPIGELCNREVVIAARDDTVFVAAQLMRTHHVGDIVIVDRAGEKNIPVGIVTDRDVVIELVATDLDPKAITIGDISVSKLAVLSEDAEISDAIQLMSHKGIRRLPIVDREGSLVGIVCMDDLLAVVAEDLSALAKLVEHEAAKENQKRQ